MPAFREEQDVLFPEIDTPSLVVDLDVMERNIRAMADLTAKHGVALRPHVKTHKSPWIAHRQLQAGARGICVAKLGEAEVMVEAGITDILLAYPVIGSHKIDRLARLLQVADIKLGIDSVEAADAASSAADRAGREIQVYVDVDTGLGRMGKPPGRPTVELAKAIDSRTGVRVVGLMTHAGHLMACQSADDVRRGVEAEVTGLVETARELRRQDVGIEHVSPGSTVGARFEAASDGVTEIRPGTYVFYDANSVFTGSATLDDCALAVLTTVVSRSWPGRAVIDAGSKTLTSDRAAGGRQGHGIVKGHEGIEIRSLSEEHGVLEVDEDRSGQGSRLRVGQRLLVIPNHVCPTVNLSDVLYGVRNGEVVREIRVLARGKRE